MTVGVSVFVSFTFLTFFSSCALHGAICKSEKPNQQNANELHFTSKMNYKGLPQNSLLNETLYFRNSERNRQLFSRQSTDSTYRIIGGYNADKNIAKYVAYILIYEKNYQYVRRYCSGVVISKDRILTAAHCFSGRITDTNDMENIADAFVFIGVQNVDKSIHNNWDNLYKAYSIDIAYKYKASEFSNDIAIITLDRYLPKSQRYPFIPSTQLKINETVFNSGYGRISRTRNTSPKFLKEVNLKYRSYNLCRDSSYFLSSKELDRNTMFCASSPVWIKGGKGACYGDSGGPLFKKSKLGRMLLYGIAAFLDGECADPSRGMWYMKVSYYRKMIKKHVRAGEDIDKISKKDWLNIF